MKITYINGPHPLLTDFAADKTFTETTNDFSERKKLMQFAREGDVITIESFSSLASSSKELVQIMNQILNKGVEVISLKEGINTGSATSASAVFAALASFEADLYKANRLAGIARARQEGKYKGRAPIKVDMDLMKSECKKWRDGKQSAVTTMRNLNLKPGTFYNRVKELGL